MGDPVSMTGFSQKEQQGNNTFRIELGDLVAAVGSHCGKGKSF